MNRLQGRVDFLKKELDILSEENMKLKANVASGWSEIIQLRLKLTSLNDILFKAGTQIHAKLCSQKHCLICKEISKALKEDDEL